jgi:hypothetical protein
MAFRQIGDPIESYDNLITTIRSRMAELKVTCETIGHIGGLAEGHVSALLAQKRKVLGRISLTVLLQVLGLKLVAIVDDAAHEPIRRRLEPATYFRWHRPQRVLDDAERAAAREMKIHTNQLLGTLPEIERARPRRRRARPSEGLAGAI